MQIIQIEYKDGRVYRISINNKSQLNKINKRISELKEKNLILKISQITNGIHTSKEFLTLISNQH